MIRLFWFIAALALIAACGSAEEPPEAQGQVEQAIPLCGPPSRAHAFNAIASIATTPQDASCPAVYYPEEPRAWSLDLSAAPPKRSDGRCPCRWLNGGVCFNRVTGNTSAAECSNGACEYHRAFECGYGSGCAYKISYSMLWAYTWTGSWNSAQLNLIVTEPGCRRVLTINRFDVVTGGVPL